jgi:hypothetical protein
MKSLARIVIVAALMGAAAAPAVRGQISNLPVRRHIEYLAAEMGRGCGETAREELKALAKRWESLDHKARTDFEKLLFVLGELTASQKDSIFGPIERKPKDKRRDLVLKEFDRLREGTSVPSRQEEHHAVCIVVLGAGVQGAIGFGDRSGENWPRIAGEILPYGTFLTGLTSAWISIEQRAYWVGELLTGRKMGGLVLDGTVFKFTKPTLLHYYLVNAKNPQRKAWVITAGDQQNIIFDHLPLQTNWPPNARPITLTSVHLRRYDDQVRDHFLSELREVKDPLKVQADLPRTLTPGILRLDTDFDDVAGRELIKDVIARRGGARCDCNAFVQEMASQLFLSDINPELVVVRFGPNWDITNVRKTRELKRLLAKKMRDDDEATYNVWSAFRRNPYYRRNGYFIILAEGHPGCIIVGPDIKKGEVKSTRYKLDQIMPTVAHMLDFDWKEFSKPYVKPTACIEEIFIKKE